MLYLGQIKKKSSLGNKELLLLARQTSDTLWEIVSGEMIPCEVLVPYGDGVLVLVKLDNEAKIIEVKEAKDWVMGLVQTYLTSPVINREWLQKEQEKVEQWRQEITAKSLDLADRQLQLKIRTEQLQELEIKLRNEYNKVRYR